MTRVPDTSKRKRATIGILVGLLLAALDGTVVATALPQILEELDGFTLYFLPNALFMLCQTVSVPIWGRLSDLYGRGRFHLLAVAILVAGSVLCAFSHTMVALVGFRAIQGLGAGGLMSLSFTMIADLYDLEERAKMQGAISSVWGLAALVGPALGGWMTKSFGWPSIFWLNVPVGIAAAVIVQSSWKDKPRADAKGRLDVLGAILLALASASLLAAFGGAGRFGWSHHSVAKCLAAAALLVLFLVYVERRRSDPFLAYDLYRNRLFTTGALTGVFAMVCMFTAIFHVPLLAVGVLGRTLMTGGNMLTCMMLPWMVCSAMTRPLLKRFGYRTLAVAGMTLAAGAYGLLLRVGMGDSLAGVVGAMLLLGTGLGVTVAPLLIAAQNAVTKDRLGTATSLTQFTRSMGAALGLAVMGTLLLAPFGGREPEGLVDRSRLDPSQLQTVVTPLLTGLHHVFLAAIVAAALGVVFALSIPSGKAAELKLPQPAPEG